MVCSQSIKNKIGLFLILFLCSCVKVSATCKVSKVEGNNLQNSLEECRDNPTINITKDF